MSNPFDDITIKIKGKLNDLAQAVGEAEALLKGMGKSAAASNKQTSSAFKGATKDAESFEQTIARLGHDGETAFQTLQREVSNTRNRIKEMRNELRHGNNTSIFGDLKAAENDLRRLEGFAKDIVPEFSASGAQAGKGFGEQLSSGLKALPGGIGPILITGIVAALMPLLPVIVSMLGGAITAAFGLGGVALGIVSAIKSPQVKSAWLELKSDFKDALAGTNVEVVDALTAALREVDGAVKYLKPELHELFDSIAPLIQPGLRAITGFVRGALPGLSAGFKAALPAMQMFANLMPELGQAFAKFFYYSQSQGTRQGLQILIELVANLLSFFGKLIGATGEFFRYLEIATADALYTFGNFASKLGLLDPAMGRLGKAATGAADGIMHSVNASSAASVSGQILLDSTNRLNQSFITANEEIAKAIVNYYDLVAASHQLDDANLQAHESLTNFMKEVKKGKDNWDITTAAGQRNLALLYNVEDEFDALYTKAGDNGGALQALLVMEQKLKDEAKAAHAPQSEIQKITDRIAALKAKIDSLKSKTITITVNERDVITRSGHGGHIPQAYGGVLTNYGRSGAGNPPAFANAGVYGGGNAPLIKFGEKRTRGEAYIPRDGAYGAQVSTLSTAAGWVGMALTPLPGGHGYRGSPGSLQGSGRAQEYLPVTVMLGGQQMATVHAALIPAAQQYKARNGNTGLT